MTLRFVAGVLLLLLCAPLCAQEGADGPPDPDTQAGADETSAAAESTPAAEKNRRLERGKDRTGFGLRIRATGGYDTNIFDVDSDLTDGLYTDGVAEAWAGLDLGFLQLGVRSTISGRTYFSEGDANTWDLQLGGFLKYPYDAAGDFGFGISGDVMYRQLHYYEILGPITRQDDLRAAEAVARIHVGYELASFLVLELGINGRARDFTEEKDLRSLDSWETGTDLGLYIYFWDFLTVRPYARFDYEWFRDQIDLSPEGVHDNGDLLQLLKFDYGADVSIQFWDFLSADGRVYSRRQDDSAQGYNRYWQIGFYADAVIDIGLLEIVGGVETWTREYDERVDPSDPNATVFERFWGIHAETSYNFWAFLHVGVRWDWNRRTSTIENEGFSTHQFSLFLGFSW